MYIIDVEYSAYEAALTSERQKFMFSSEIAGQVLTAVSVLVPIGTTARTLTGAAGVVNASTGYYDKDLVIAKTIQIVEAQMRAKRDIVAKNILLHRSDSTVTYPLSAALSDLEDYYRAGTMNTGLIQAAGDAADNAANAADDKAVTVNFVAITELGKRILAFSKTNSKAVRNWIDLNAGGVPLAYFVHSGRADLLQKIIADLSIP